MIIRSVSVIQNLAVGDVKTRQVTAEVTVDEAKSWLKGESALCDIIRSRVPQPHGFVRILCKAEEARDTADGRLLNLPSDLH